MDELLSLERLETSSIGELVAYVRSLPMVVPAAILDVLAGGAAQKEDLGPWGSYAIVFEGQR